ncbi:hypothetical protein O181_026291 [Austropuccinia psidii MF-1]|uniref:Uncharacterized protein n=1 Tax=Austropuccinia psidii MF-1 TaxID=1389203 RepID=A0A9Q3CQ48_9BASI|nr:hypothetical protein [Austropuccinia psidii MF-1]
MSTKRNGSNCSIQSKGSGPGHSSHKSKRQECQPRGEAQIEDLRTYTSSQSLASAFEALLESTEADITAIPVVRSEPFPTGNNGNIPVSVQELVYGGKTEGVGTFSKPLDSKNKLLFSIKEALGPTKDRETSDGLATHVLQRTSPKDKSLVEKPKNFLRVPEERFDQKEGKQPGGSSLSLHKQELGSRNAKKW